MNNLKDKTIIIAKQDIYTSNDNTIEEAGLYSKDEIDSIFSLSIPKGAKLIYDKENDLFYDIIGFDYCICDEFIEDNFKIASPKTKMLEIQDVVTEGIKNPHFKIIRNPLIIEKIAKECLDLVYDEDMNEYSKNVEVNGENYSDYFDKLIRIICVLEVDEAVIRQVATIETEDYDDEYYRNGFFEFLENKELPKYLVRFVDATNEGSDIFFNKNCKYAEEFMEEILGFGENQAAFMGCFSEESTKEANEWVKKLPETIDKALKNNKKEPLWF